MKFLTHPAVTALGLAYLCLVGLAGPLVSPNDTTVYHLSGSASAIFVPVIVYFLLLWLVMTSLITFVASRPRMWVLLWSTILFFGPWVLWKNYTKLTVATVPHWLNLLVFAVSLTGFVIFQSIWGLPLRSWFDRVQRFLAVLFGFTSFTGLLMLSQLLWFGWQARSLNAPLSLHQRSSSSAMIRKPRIIWVVMDELSYQQIYEQRFPGANLPAFDQLASDSTVFTHVVPAGIETQIVIPSLLTGSPADKIRPSSDGLQLTLHNPDTVTWQVFDPHQTIFQDALQAGYSTAIAGWYNPYCRVLPEVLDRCFWTSHIPFSAGISDHQSIGTNLLAPLFRLGATVPTFLSPRHITSPGDLIEVRGTIVDFETLSISADQLIADPTANFLYLHMPIPHPPGIYDRRHATFVTSHSSYVDNLALADQFIAHIRRALEQRGQWDSSAIVIMGDHSWRTKLVWTSSDMWTSEDEAASHGGQFDDRPAYIVKMPYQQTPARIDSRFAAIRTRALLDGIIDGRLKTADDLAAWAAQQP
jgi:hypothetical protein